MWYTVSVQFSVPSEDVIKMKMGVPHPAVNEQCWQLDVLIIFKLKVLVIYKKI